MSCPDYEFRARGTWVEGVVRKRLPLRHTFLTNIANGIGMDDPVHILKVKELAGHSNIETTMVYVHSDGIENTSSLQWSRLKRQRTRN